MPIMVGEVEVGMRMGVCGKRWLVDVTADCGAAVVEFLLGS